MNGTVELYIIANDPPWKPDVPPACQVRGFDSYRINSYRINSFRINSFNHFLSSNTYLLFTSFRQISNNKNKYLHINIFKKLLINYQKADKPEGKGQDDFAESERGNTRDMYGAVAKEIDMDGNYDDEYGDEGSTSMEPDATPIGPRLYDLSFNLVGLGDGKDGGTVRSCNTQVRRDDLRMTPKAACGTIDCMKIMGHDIEDGEIAGDGALEDVDLALEL